MSNDEELERVAQDVMLAHRVVDGRKTLVALVAAGNLSAPEVARAIARAREVLKNEPREVTGVECVHDDILVRSNKKRARARLQ